MKLDLIHIQTFLRNKNIVLLGNALSILNTKKNIDKYDIVCRCNKGYPNGKEEYIGKRTDILFLSTKINGITIQRKFNPKFVVWMTKINHLTTEYVKNNAIQNPQEDWRELYNKYPDKKRPSTGCIALYFLIKHIKFKSLDLLGFDFFTSRSWYNANDKCHDAHLPKIEKKIIMEIINENDNIKIIGD